MKLWHGFYVAVGFLGGMMAANWGQHAHWSAEVTCVIIAYAVLMVATVPAHRCGATRSEKRGK